MSEAKVEKNRRRLHAVIVASRRLTSIENVERVADRPGDDNGVKPGELVAREVVVGDASAGS